MKLIRIKQKLVKVGVFPNQVKSEFGDLRFRVTWEAAYEKYCSYQELPVIRVISEQAEVNNIVDFVHPAPPAIVAPPASPPPPEEENAPQTQPPIPPQKEETIPGDGRRAKLRSLPGEHLYLALVSSAREYVFGQQPMEHDESVVTAASLAPPQLWVNGAVKVNRLPTYSLSPPFQLINSNARSSGFRTLSISGGSRSPPK
ncbi:MAG: hypothetical protein SWX82_18985 [Cyanobacteriota bacterium]|nr:hypothetical protein [Cyanobacteriota bacterium]